MDFEYGFDKCPICDSKLSKKYDFFASVISCSNECFYCSYDDNLKDYSNNTKIIRIYELNVFHENLKQYEINKDRLFSHFNEKVAYWRENDRYLMKIIAGE